MINPGLRVWIREQKGSKRGGRRSARKISRFAPSPLVVFGCNDETHVRFVPRHMRKAGRRHHGCAVEPGYDALEDGTPRARQNAGEAAI